VLSWESWAEQLLVSCNLADDFPSRRARTAFWKSRQRLQVQVAGLFSLGNGQFLRRQELGSRSGVFQGRYIRTTVRKGRQHLKVFEPSRLDHSGLLNRRNRRRQRLQVFIQSECSLKGRKGLALGQRRQQLQFIVDGQLSGRMEHL
jgi:hypothetical protein